MTIINYKFFGYSELTVEWFYLYMLNKAYIEYDFKKINKIFIEIYSNRFILEKHKTNILNIYCKNLKVKWILTKKILNYKYNKRDLEPINTEFLDFCTPTMGENNESSIDITLNNNKYYRFSKKELIEIFKISLLYHVEGIPEPKIPNNPYSGVQFSLKDIINIFINFNNIKLPFILKIFKQSSFNLDNMINIHRIYLLMESSKNYINELSDYEIHAFFNNFYNNYNIKNIACKKCILQIPDFLNEFKPILIKLVFNSNIDIEYNIGISTEQMFFNLINFYNITPEKTHYIKHRKFVRVRK